MSAACPIPAHHPDAAPVQAAVDALRARFGAEPPQVALVLGSGLSSLIDALTDADACDAVEVGLPASSIAGHPGQVVLGKLGGVPIAVLAGRVHRYEGHPPEVVVRAVRSLAAWGVSDLLLTNAAGAARAELAPGTLVRITDHLDLGGPNPLVGAPWGERFPDAARMWNPSLGACIDAAAVRAAVPLQRGVYAAMFGPAFETAAEVRMLRVLGADVIGMSTVPEGLAAFAAGMRVAGLSVVSNYGAGVSGDAVDHESVLDVASDAAAQVAALLGEALRAWP